jgi:sodium/hydrogen antiporter
VIAESIGYGVLMGVVADVLAGFVHRRATTAGDEEQADWRCLLTLVAPALAYGLAAPLDGSGFIAAFVAGLVHGTMRGPASRHRAAPRRGDRRDAQRRDVRRGRSRSTRC